MGWKEDLQKSYNDLAEEDIKQSDKQYDLTKSQAFRNALGRGMQRSSYIDATQANYDKSKVEAAGAIRKNYNAQFQQAALEHERWQREYEMQQEQLRLQQEQQALARQQAEWAQSNWQAEFNYKTAQNAGAATTPYSPAPNPGKEEEKPTDEGLLGGITPWYKKVGNVAAGTVKGAVGALGAFSSIYSGLK